MNRCLVFLNHLQHKVKEMTNESQTVGVRKILCFFLVDPSCRYIRFFSTHSLAYALARIISTIDIPPQQWDKVKSGLALTLCGVLWKLKIEFPPELVRYILGFAKCGFTLEEAKAHRLELMKERKYYVDANNRIWERSFSFCEH